MSGLWSYRTENITLIFLTYFFISFSKAKTRQSWPICQQSATTQSVVDWNNWDYNVFTTESYDYYEGYYDAYD